MADPMPPDDDQDDFDPNPKKKSGFPIWAILLIVFGVLGVCCVPIMIGLLLPAVQKVRDTAARVGSQNNMRQIGLGVHTYNDVHGQLPPAGLVPETGKPPSDATKRLSWRVGILPYIEQFSLHKQFKLDQAWDSSANAAAAGTVVQTFLDPADGVADATTRYRGFVGPGTVFEPGVAVTFAKIPDGTSNTILFVDATDPVRWAQNKELPFNPGGPLPPLGAKDRDVIMVTFCDGSVRPISKTVNPTVLKASITRNGNETLPADW